MLARALFITSFIFFGLFSNPALAADSISLDELMSPDQLAHEVGNLHPTEMTPLTRPFALQQELMASGLNVYQEFPVVVDIDKSTQRMHVYHRGQKVETFKVSTGREKWENPPSGVRYFSSTPNGWYTPQRYVVKHESRTWDATMRYAIFFNGGIAIHATSLNHYLSLGRKTSGGCVRLTRGNAKWLWNLARSQGRTQVPVFTRSGQIVRDAAGNVKRQTGSPILIIVRGN